jgi:hypothetical protein
MKLKKVTALLLATSMVLSSVSVASFADELVFEQEVVEDSSSADEAYFGDDAVENEVTEDTEDETVSEEEAFFDEVIEENPSVDEAVEAEAYAFEEDVVAEPEADVNADIYEAIANDEAAYDAVQRPVPESYTWTYNGENHEIVVTGLETPYYYGGPSDAVPDSWTLSAPTLTNTGDSGRYWVKGTQIINGQPTEGTWYVDVTINKATITATLKAKKFNYGNYDGKMGNDLAFSDFAIVGLQGSDTKEEVLAVAEDVDWTTLQDAAQTSTLNELIPGVYDIYTDQDNAPITFADDYEADNYNLVFDSEKVTIEKLPVTLVWGNDESGAFVKKTTFDYNNEEHTVIAQIDKASALTTEPVVDYDEEGKQTATKTGTYKAIAILRNGNADDISDYCEIKNKECVWSIGQATIRVGVALEGLHVYYGTKDPTVGLTAANVAYYCFDGDAGEWVVIDDGTPITTDMLDITGTPKFTSPDYKQYDPVTVITGVGADGPVYKNRYKVVYAGGLTSKNFNLVAYDSMPGFIIVDPAPVVVNATKVTAEMTKPAEDVSEAYEITDYVDPATGKAVAPGTAESLKRDIKDGLASIELKTDPLSPSAVGKYPISIVLKTKSKAAMDNYDVLYKNPDGDTVFATPSPAAYAPADEEYEPGEAGNGRRSLISYGPDRNSAISSWTFVDVEKYEVIFGDFTLELKDNEVTYDGNAHGLIMEPETKPDSLEIFYRSTTDADFDAEAGWGWTDDFN